MDEEKKSAALQKINLLSEKIGLEEDAEKTILSIEKTQNPDQKILTLKSGNWDSDEPWFAIDEDGKVHTMLSLDTLLQIIKALKNTQEENFNLKLEKAIWQNIPIDFQDVWVVAMDEVKKELKEKKDKKTTLHIDIEKIIKEIKKKHPNLFLSLDKYLMQDNFKDIV